MSVIVSQQTQVFRPSIVYGTSAEGYHLPVGFAVYRDANGLYLLASAAGATPAAGIVYVSSAANYQVGVISAGFVTLNNWSAVTGTPALTVGATYYLAVLPGRLTTNSAEPAAIINQAIGLATSGTTMQILGNLSLKPTSGLSLSVTVVEDLTGEYWVLKFVNGLLSSATHYAAPTASDVVLSDGAGGFWNVVVDSGGNLGAEPSTGPQTAAPVIADGSGGFWKMVVDPSGNLGAESNSGPATTGVVLADGSGGYWLIVVGTAGNLGAMTTGAPAVSGVTLTSPNGSTWQLVVDDSGNLGAEPV